MVAAIESKRDAIAALCRKHGVVRLHVFGSALRDDFRPGESDVDLLVEFGPMTGHDKAHAYFDLLDELGELFGARVDLVMAGLSRIATSLVTSSPRSRNSMPRSIAAYLSDIVGA